MENKLKGKIAIIGTVSLIAIGGVLCFSNGVLNKTFASINEAEAIWNHYSAVNPTNAHAGSKEYWISCLSHQILFTAPEEYKQIVDRGVPQETFASDDPRFIPSIGSVPTLINDGTQVTYGLYPQTNLGNNYLYLTNELRKLSGPESNGYYLYNGQYYAKRVCYEGTQSVFDAGEGAAAGYECWFKVEPIKWNVLKVEDGKYLLLSDKLLDTQRYNERYDGLQDGVYANNYKDSEIRSYLNNDFFDQAFMYGSANIQVTNIDNSSNTYPDYDEETYFCDDTQDKVFLLSYADYENAEYGFVSDNSRIGITTDYARAANAYGNSPYYKEGYYWTRTPNDLSEDRAIYVRTSGSIEERRVGLDNTCIRPAITITID